MTNEIEKQYADLRKKYKLPDYKELDLEFEISELETNFLLRHINRRIGERMDFFAGVMEEILQPDTSNMYALHETRYFSEHEKKSMYELYKRLMSLNRTLLELSIKRSEKEDAEFLIGFFKDWKSIKTELVRYVTIMKDSWKSEIELKEDVEYMG